MTRNVERVAIYTAYLAFILAAVLMFASKAGAWTLKHEYKTPLTKVCASCLADFAGCMDMVDKFNDDKDDDVDPQVYVRQKLSCVTQAAQCTEENKCGTKVVLDKTP